MRRTTFIVGAGASTEFGLGAGAALATAIRTLLRTKASVPESWVGNGPFEDAIRALSASDADIVSASDTLRRGIHFSNSIDDFLHDNRDNELVVRLGKLAIAHCMLQQEASAPALQQLASDNIEVRSSAFRKTTQTWLDLLFRRLKRGHTKHEARDVLNGVSFVVFNYDRCLEQFLYHALADSLDLPAAEAKAVFESIPIEHVYGGLGPLPFQTGSGAVPFGETRVPITRLATQIRTYTEEVSGTSATIINGLLSDAEQLVFLGYAFHEQGMKLLFPNAPKVYHRVFLTQLGLHTTVARAIDQRFSASNRFALATKCADAIESWQFDLLS